MTIFGFTILTPRQREEWNDDLNAASHAADENYARYWQEYGLRHEREQQIEVMRAEIQREKMAHAIELATALYDPERGQSNTLARRIVEAAEMLHNEDRQVNLPTRPPAANRAELSLKA